VPFGCGLVVNSATIRQPGLGPHTRDGCFKSPENSRFRSEIDRIFASMEIGIDLEFALNRNAIINAHVLYREFFSKTCIDEYTIEEVSK
jgi:hypothetical protein